MNGPKGFSRENLNATDGQLERLELKLFYVEGVRHSAVVLARNKRQAVRLAVDASRNEKPNPYVLYGYIGSWEVPHAYELRLPEGYRFI